MSVKRGDHGSAVSATLTGITDLFKPKTRIGELDENLRIDGKSCLVTGSSSGLGKATALRLARRGGRIIMACRGGHPQAGEDVRRQSGSDSVEMEYIDLNDLSTVTDFCERMKERGIQFDICVFNAGVVPGEARRTRDGFEEMFQVNYLAKFFFIRKLFEHGCIRGARESDPGYPRIVFTSSEAHRSSEPLDLESLGEFAEYSMGGSMKQYGYTKLLLTTYFTELDRRLADGNGTDGHRRASVFALCPGPVNTRIARDAPAVFQPLLKIVFGIFFRSPYKGSEPVEYLCCAPELSERSGVYLHLMTEKPVSEDAADPEMGKKLWETTEKLLENLSVKK
jgi:NAD(P)-dependent dehydrogenase (short-subunit alcohol dehydrogenase family)